MTASWVIIAILALLVLGAAASVRILKQYERGASRPRSGASR